jgi:hypothetical protein
MQAKFEFGPGPMIYKSYPPWTWKKLKIAFENLAACGGIYDESHQVIITTLESSWSSEVIEWSITVKSNVHHLINWPQGQ